MQCLVMTAQLIQNRAVRAEIALAAIHEVLKRTLHGLHFDNTLVQVLHMPDGDFADIRAGAPLVLPEFQQLGYLQHAEAQAT